MTVDQAAIDKMNSEFWNELCGTGLARHLGITDHSPQSLQRFDEGYFALYPYLLSIIKPQRTAGKDVLEIGLGYGSVGQKLAEAGARYNGLDIAPNAVRMSNLRMQIQGYSGKAVCGSALEMPFADQSFDFVFSIGCFHVTGNTQRCFDETYRVLRPGGTAVLMVYNKFSLRQWTRWPIFTLKELLRDWSILGSKEKASEDQRRAADPNQAGAAAPEMVFLSKRQLRNMLCRFDRVSFQKQNVDDIPFPYFWTHRFVPWLTFQYGRLRWKFTYQPGYLFERKSLLSTVGRLMGLDIFIEVKKAGQAPVTAGSIGAAPLAKAG